MYLRVRKRKKNGKTHRYWSIVESRRISGDRIVQKQLLYLGELNDVQHAGFVRALAGDLPIGQRARIDCRCDQNPYARRLRRDDRPQFPLHVGGSVVDLRFL